VDDQSLRAYIHELVQSVLREEFDYGAAGFEFRRKKIEEAKASLQKGPKR
jgi:hypothetical protein